jgi:hypothetical protein
MFGIHEIARLLYNAEFAPDELQQLFLPSTLSLIALAWLNEKLVFGF